MINSVYFPMFSPQTRQVCSMMWLSWMWTVKTSPWVSVVRLSPLWSQSFYSQFLPYLNLKVTCTSSALHLYSLSVIVTLVVLFISAYYIIFTELNPSPEKACNYLECANIQSTINCVFSF